MDRQHDTLASQLTLHAIKQGLQNVHEFYTVIL
jgi:hypothetical protein